MNNNSSYIEENTIKTWGLSILLHLLIFALWFGFKHTIADFFKEQKQINLSIIETSIKVNIVDMPKMTLKELKVLSQDTGKWQKEIKEERIQKTKKLIAKKKANFLTQLTKLSERKTTKIKQVKKNNKQKVLKYNTKKLKALINAGNKLSSGTNLIGEKNREETTSEMTRYADIIVELIRPFWQLPTYLMDKDLICRVQIFINKNGDLIKIKIVQSSDNAEYDQRSISAIKSAAPFSPPPQIISNKIIQGEMILGFPL